MRKYWFLFKSNLASRFEYRMENFLWAIIDTVSLAFAIFVWTAVYKTNSQVGDYNFAQMIIYYALIPVVGSLVYVHHINYGLPRSIKDGQISTEIIKPYNLSFNYFLKSTCIKIVQQFIKMPIFIIALIIITHALKVSFTPVNLIIGLIICLFSYLMNFFIDLSIAYLAFWVDEVWSFGHFKTILLSIFGGLAFPLSIIPLKYTPVFDFMPLRYVFYFPISVIQGKLNSLEIIKGLVIIMVWITIFFTISQILWYKGLRKYSSNGG